MENKLKHLEFIEGVINRMAQNSFLLKAWCVSLLVALSALSGPESKKGYIFIAYFALFAFAILDAFYLRQEKLFRALYNHVRVLNEKNIDFSMNTGEFKINCKWWHPYFSVSIYLFYLPLIIIMLKVIPII